MHPSKKKPPFSSGKYIMIDSSAAGETGLLHMAMKEGHKKGIWAAPPPEMNLARTTARNPQSQPAQTPTTKLPSVREP